MKAGVGIDSGLALSFEQQRSLVHEAARLGYDSLWMPAGATARSAFLTCARWWQASCEVVPAGLGVGISVVPFPAWTAPTLAAEAASVSEMTGGKLSLGIGLGGYTSAEYRRSLGLADHPAVAFTRDYLMVLRGLLAGGEVAYEGRTLSVRGKLAFTAPPTPVYLAALGPQMLRLSGALADGVTPNWSSPEQIVWLREQVAEAARSAGRDPAELPFAQYIRVCVDEDVEAARRAFCSQVLGYAMARPGQPKDKGYRAHFGRMGFEDVLTDLEARRDAGTPMRDLLDLVPVELLQEVGYFGPPAGAAEALRRLSQGLDETMVRLLAVRPGDLDAAVTSIQACQPSGWR